jgi:arsenate reductase (glutaredoxin)
MADELVIFGIKNCDSVKKTRDWFDTRGISYRFHDFRVEGLSKDLLQTWLDAIGPETLINNRSTTWKQLSAEERRLAMGKSAAAVVLANPTLIKRPVVAIQGKLLVGFQPDIYAVTFP